MKWEAQYLFLPIRLVAEENERLKTAQAIAELNQQVRVPRTAAKIGESCQAYTFNRFTVFEAIDKTAEAGRVIEFYPGQTLSKEHADVKWDHNASDEVVAQVKAKLAERNLVAVNYGVVDIPKDEAGARKVFEFAKKLACAL
jgi:hypothetical protein